MPSPKPLDRSGAKHEWSRLSSSSRVREFLLTLPSFGWLVVFFLLPVLIVLVLAFRPADALGGVGEGWTLDHLAAVMAPSLHTIWWRTLWISLVTTAACVVIAVPVSLVMARAGGAWKNLLLLLVVVPFWTSFLIRVFAWKSLLHPQGLISQALQSMGLIEDGGVLLYNYAAVVLVMICTQLPFAILPLYAAAEKFDFALLEAARDLGATAWQAFTRVFLPGIIRGMGAAALMVFVATIGMYVVPDIVGGTDAEMIGNKIAQRVQSDRNLPEAAALSAALLVAVSLLLLLGWRIQQRGSEGKEAAS